MYLRWEHIVHNAPSQISILRYFVVFHKPFKNWFSLPIRQIELKMYEEAKALFEKENPGALWRPSSGKKPPIRQRFATLIERQQMLGRIRTVMGSGGRGSSGR